MGERPCSLCCGASQRESAGGADSVFGFSPYIGSKPKTIGPGGVGAPTASEFGRLGGGAEILAQAACLGPKTAPWAGVRSGNTALFGRVGAAMRHVLRPRGGACRMAGTA